MANILGLITVNGKQILEVDAVPSAAAGTPGPMGSLAMYDTGSAGEVYIKTSSGDTAWTKIEIPDQTDWNLNGNTLGANSSIGSLDDFDMIFIRNNIELMRMVGTTAAAQALLIGLNASVGGRLQLKANALADDVLKQMSPNGGSGSDVIHVSRQYKAFTTNATDTTLADVAIPTDTVVGITAKVVGRQTGGGSGAAGDGAVYVREIHARNNAGTVSIRQTQTSFTSEDLASFNITPSVSTTNVRLQVRGGASRDISWFGHVELLIAGS